MWELPWGRIAWSKHRAQNGESSPEYRRNGSGPENGPAKVWRRRSRDTHMKLCNGVLIALALLVVGGCSTTPEDQTATRVEDRKPPAASTAVTAPVRSPKIATVDLSKPTSKPLAAPAG